MNIQQIQDHRDLLKIKLLLLFSTVTYWMWSFYLEKVAPNSNEDLLGRVIISFVSGCALWITHKNNLTPKRLNFIANFVMSIHLIHNAYLVWLNDWSTFYIVGFFAVSLIICSSVLSFRDFIFFAVTSLLLPVIVQFLKPTDLNFLIYFLAISTSVFCFMSISIYSNFKYRSEMITSSYSAIQSSRMAALGQMAAGMAHEINNPLAIIKGKSDQILMKMISDSPVDKEYLKTELAKIGTTVEKIAKIIRSLRSFSKDSSAEPKALLPLEHIINNTLQLCQEKIKNRGIILKINSIPQVSIVGKENQLVQVLFNIITNSIDALETVKDKWIEISFFEAQDQIQIKISDSGIGMSEVEKEKAMEPFYTTKPPGKGAGLGLNISKGILESLNGSLKVDMKSENTCFIIEIPVKKNANKVAA
jgi:signal transduction histidine kinase